MNRHESATRIRVRYHETDQMGIAWHGNYLSWFEVARTEWLRDQGMSYRRLEGEGVFLPVLRSVCNYAHAAHYDDVLVVRARLAAYNGVRLSFFYEIDREHDARAIARGETEHAIAGRSLKPLRAARAAPDLHRALTGGHDA